MEKEGHEVAVAAIQSFDYIDENVYSAFADGHSIHTESMRCQCQFSQSSSTPDSSDDPDDACGEQCINRLLFVECLPAFCPVGEGCLNRRFQKREYAPVDIFLTAEKGYGLKAKQDIAKGQFVIEYVGEVVDSVSFKKRTKLYEAEGIKHMYFMSLKSDQVIDATRRGGIARFMNHSCDPNCVLQKWVVGQSLRMGIFAKRNVSKGEELSFDYKFERYGAPAQPCFCGSAMCKGTIGTSKDRSQSNATSLDSANLDLDDEEESGDEEDVMISKSGSKPLQSVDEVTSFVQRFLQSTDGNSKRALKMIDRLLITDSAPVVRKFVQMHGLVLLKQCLRSFSNDTVICRKVMNSLQKLPITTRNTIDDCDIVPVMEKFFDHTDPVVSILSRKMVDDWAELEKVYRIPKAPKKKIAAAATLVEKKRKTSADVISAVSEESVKRSKYEGFVNPHRKNRFSDLSNSWQSRSNSVSSSTPLMLEPFAAPLNKLPDGWKYTYTPTGDIYYYDIVNGKTQWEFPAVSAEPETPAAPVESQADIVAKIAAAAQMAMENERTLAEKKLKSARAEKKLQKQREEKEKAEKDKREREEKERKLSEEKQRKLRKDKERKNREEKERKLVQEKERKHRAEEGKAARSLSATKEISSSSISEKGKERAESTHAVNSSATVEVNKDVKDQVFS
eukprot:Partr_v1_DN28736_c0_g2_i4_m62490 putative SET domain containing 2